MEKKSKKKFNDLVTMVDYSDTLENRSDDSSDKVVYDSARMFFKEIKKHPLLTEEEEHETALLVAAGDREARKKMILSNFRLVVSIAKRYSSLTGCGFDFMDIIQEGNIGLMNAVDKFDASLGNRFSTYATPWIKQAILRAIGNNGRMIRLPIHIQRDLRNLKAAMAELTERLGRQPSTHELGKATGLSKDQIRILLDSDFTMKSMDEEIGDDGDSFGSLLADDRIEAFESQMVNDELRGAVFSILKEMEEMEAKVLIKRFGLNGGEEMAPNEVSKELGISHDRVRRIETKAMMKIRKSDKADDLREYIA